MTTFAGRPVFPGLFIDPTGDPQGSVEITVYVADPDVDIDTLTALNAPDLLALADVYTDRTKDTPADNPFTADAAGNAWPFLDPGDYVGEANGGFFPFSVVPDTADVILTSGSQEKAGTLTLRDSNLKLRAEASPTAAPELHFHSANGAGTGDNDKLAWGIGIDVSAPTPARDLAVFKAVGASVADELYANHRGALPSSWAFGQAPADDAFKLSIVAAGASDPAQGGLKIQIGGTTTEKALTLRDGALVDRFYVDETFTLRGAHALSGAAVCIRAEATNHRALAMCDSDGTNYNAWVFDGGNLKLRSVTAGLDIFMASGAADLFHVYRPFQSGNNSIIGANAANTVGFYGTTGVAKQTGVAVTAAGIHTALVALGLIAA